VVAGLGYLLFAVAPFWYTPHSGGPGEYGFHWLVTLVANCYLVAGLAFLAYMAWRAYLVMTATAPPPGPAGVGRTAVGTVTRGGVAGCGYG
jgi:alpha-1,2-mannosyltransferase